MCKQSKFQACATFLVKVKGGCLFRQVEKQACRDMHPPLIFFSVHPSIKCFSQYTHEENMSFNGEKHTEAMTCQAQITLHFHIVIFRIRRLTQIKALPFEPCKKSWNHIQSCETPSQIYSTCQSSHFVLMAGVYIFTEQKGVVLRSLLSDFVLRRTSVVASRAILRKWQYYGMVTTRLHRLLRLHSLEF